MNKVKTLIKMDNSGIMAIVRVDTVERGLEIAHGCVQGGVHCMEISYTNANAGEVIKAIKEKFGSSICVGAGTVLDTTTARLAIMNGAEFIIAPNFDKEVCTLANLYQIPYCPGCTTYSEMLEALKCGASYIKAFPISNYYGPNLAKTFKVPCPQIPIMASGGITMENLGEWYKNGAELLGIGGLLTKGSIDEIARNAQDLKEKLYEARGY